MRISCPCCATDFPIEAGFAEADGKRLAVLFADVEPALGRGVLGYLRLFRPAKQGLRLARAVNIAQEVIDLVRAGRVSIDERTGVWRATTPALWTEGIERLLSSPPSSLPLTGHGYLRKTVFTLAEKHEADAERRQEEDRRTGRHREGARQPVKEDKLANAIAFANHLFGLDRMTAEERDAHIADARARYGAAP